MPLVTHRDHALELTQQFSAANASMPIFCTATHWNTEAILLPSQQIGEKYNLSPVPVAVAMTFIYSHMPQAKRITYSQHEVAGFISSMAHLKAQCDSRHAPYRSVAVLLYLDHADPRCDPWALRDGVPHLATVMFGAQKYALEDNLVWTNEYVRTYDKQVLVEGIFEELALRADCKASSAMPSSRKSCTTWQRLK